MPHPQFALSALRCGFLLAVAEPPIADLAINPVRVSRITHRSTAERSHAATDEERAAAEPDGCAVEEHPPPHEQHGTHGPPSGLAIHAVQQGAHEDHVQHSTHVEQHIRHVEPSVVFPQQRRLGDEDVPEEGQNDHPRRQQNVHQQQRDEKRPVVLAPRALLGRQHDGKNDRPRNQQDGGTRQQRRAPRQLPLEHVGTCVDLRVPVGTKQRRLGLVRPLQRLLPPLTDNARLQIDARLLGRGCRLPPLVLSFLLARRRHLEVQAAVEQLPPRPVDFGALLLVDRRLGRRQVGHAAAAEAPGEADLERTAAPGLGGPLGVANRQNVGVRGGCSGSCGSCGLGGGASVVVSLHSLE
mmetsp:Transcript_34814/g.86352  ORF Transcript_34814/g.86352 Transcript_34814/m.86352 type:complete len:354 (+) Transcript_34814:720-1781(+)